MRSPASSEQRDRPSGLLCGRLLVALVESVLRPGGWENVCRLKCHCVRHIDVDNKHGRSVKAIHSFLSHILPTLVDFAQSLDSEKLAMYLSERCGRR